MKTAPRAASPLLDLGLIVAGAQIGALHEVARAVGMAWPALEQVIGGQRGAQGAAGIARRRLDPDPSRRRRRASTLPLATQLSATPPAQAQILRNRRSPPRATRVRRSTISSVTAWIEAARSISRWLNPRVRVGRGGAPNRASKLANWSCVSPVQ